MFVDDSDNKWSVFYIITDLFLELQVLYYQLYILLCILRWFNVLYRNINFYECLL